jgi:hypothetical protein
MATDYAIGEGLQRRIDEQNLTALGPEAFVTTGYSMVLTDQGPVWYSKFENQVVGPFVDAEE